MIYSSVNNFKRGESMKLTNKIVSSIILFCFLFNTALSDYALSQTFISRANTDNLAASSMFGTLQDVQDTDIRKLRGVSLLHLFKLLKNIPSGLKPDSFLQSLRKELSRETKGQGINVHPGMVVFFNETMHLKDTFYYAKCRIVDAKLFKPAGTARTYYVVFSSKRDEGAYYPFEIYPKEEFEATRDRIIQSGKIMPRTAAPKDMTKEASFWPARSNKTVTADMLTGKGGADDVFVPDNVSIYEALNRFTDDMDHGLAGKKSSLKMLSSYSGSPTGKEKGIYYALDVGGSNIRVMQIKLNGDGTYQILNTEEYRGDADKKGIPVEAMTKDADALFGFIAKFTSDFLNKGAVKAADANIGKPVFGFTWSFPIEQTAINSGKHLLWTKKPWSATGVVGNDPVKLLTDAFKKQNNLKDANIAALCNDTVSVLAHARYAQGTKLVPYECLLGVVLGTGTNACVRLIPKEWLDRFGPKTPAGDLMVNIEWGNFDKLSLNAYDQIIDDNSGDLEGVHYLEKMTAGSWLSEVARVTLDQMMKQRLIFKHNVISADKISATLSTKDGLDPALFTDVVNDAPGNILITRDVLGKLGIQDASENDCRTVKYLFDAILKRAGRTIAVAIAASFLEADIKVSKDYTVAIDGSCYRYNNNYRKYIEEALITLLGAKRAGRIHLVLTMDASSVGAAITAATVTSTTHIAAEAKLKEEAQTIANMMRIFLEKGPRRNFGNVAADFNTLFKSVKGTGLFNAVVDVLVARASAEMFEFALSNEFADKLAPEPRAILNTRIKPAQPAGNEAPFALGSGYYKLSVKTLALSMFDQLDSAFLAEEFAQAQLFNIQANPWLGKWHISRLFPGMQLWALQKKGIVVKEAGKAQGRQLYSITNKGKKILKQLRLELAKNVAEGEFKAIMPVRLDKRGAVAVKALSDAFSDSRELKELINAYLFPESIRDMAAWNKPYPEYFARIKTILFNLGVPLYLDKYGRPDISSIGGLTTLRIALDRKLEQPVKPIVMKEGASQNPPKDMTKAESRFKVSVDSHDKKMAVTVPGGRTIIIGYKEGATTSHEFVRELGDIFKGTGVEVKVDTITKNHKASGFEPVRVTAAAANYRCVLQRESSFPADFEKRLNEALEAIRAKSGTQAAVPTETGVQAAPENIETMAVFMLMGDLTNFNFAMAVSTINKLFASQGRDAFGRIVDRLIADAPKLMLSFVASEPYRKEMSEAPAKIIADKVAKTIVPATPESKEAAGEVFLNLSKLLAEEGYEMLRSPDLLCAHRQGNLTYFIGKDENGTLALTASEFNRPVFWVELKENEVYLSKDDMGQIYLVVKEAALKPIMERCDGRVVKADLGIIVKEGALYDYADFDCIRIISSTWATKSAIKPYEKADEAVSTVTTSVQRIPAAHDTKAIPAVPVKPVAPKTEKIAPIPAQHEISPSTEFTLLADKYFRLFHHDTIQPRRQQVQPSEEFLKLLNGGAAKSMELAAAISAFVSSLGIPGGVALSTNPAWVRAVEWMFAASRENVRAFYTSAAYRMLELRIRIALRPYIQKALFPPLFEAMELTMVPAPDEVAVVNMGNARQVLLSIVPKNGNTLKQKADDVFTAVDEWLAMNGMDRNAIVTQNIFLKNPADKKELSEIIGKRYSTAPPSTGYMVQPPANGEAFAVEITAMGGISGSEVEITRIDKNTTVVKENGTKWCYVNGIEPDESITDAEGQALDAFHKMRASVEKAGFNFEDVVRTWLYQRKIVDGGDGTKDNYHDLNRARNRVFQQWGENGGPIQFGKRHFRQYSPEKILPPASTGIGTDESSQWPITMACLVMTSENPNAEIVPIENPYQDSTWEYDITAPKPSFSRAMEVSTKRRLILVSGTASVEKSEVIWPGDLEKQTHKTIENVGRVLAQVGATLKDIPQIRVYVKPSGSAETDRANYEKVKSIVDKAFPNVAKLYLMSDVCRNGWLVEIEAVAYLPKKADMRQFAQRVQDAYSAPSANPPKDMTRPDAEKLSGLNAGAIMSQLVKLASEAKSAEEDWLDRGGNRNAGRMSGALAAFNRKVAETGSAVALELAISALEAKDTYFTTQIAKLRERIIELILPDMKEAGVILSPPTQRYTLIVDNNMYKNGELNKDIDGYDIPGAHIGARDRFDLKSANTSDIDNILEKIADPENTIVQVSGDLTREELSRLRKEKPGVRIIRVNTTGFASRTDMNETARRNARFDIYNMMRLARRITKDDIAQKNSIWRALNFMIDTHERTGEMTAVADYIEALAKNDLESLMRIIKTNLSYVPAARWRTPKYEEVTATLMFA
jgi:hexokinase